MKLYMSNYTFKMEPETLSKCCDLYCIENIWLKEFPKWLYISLNMIKSITYLLTIIECWRIFQKVHPLQVKTLSTFKLDYLTRTQFCVKNNHLWSFPQDWRPISLKLFLNEKLCKVTTYDMKITTLVCFQKVLMFLQLEFPRILLHTSTMVWMSLIYWELLHFLTIDKPLIHTIHEQLLLLTWCCCYYCMTSTTHTHKSIKIT
jgi:hypothetical protein